MAMSVHAGRSVRGRLPRPVEGAGLALAVVLTLVACTPPASVSPTPASSSGPTSTTAAVPSDESSTPAPASSSAPSPVLSTPNPANSATPTAEQPGVLSADLIKAAVADGSLDEATGLLYRVYAIFGDPRLPDVYWSGRAHEDVVAQMRAVRELDSLPSAIAAELRPYLARPTDLISPFFDVMAEPAAESAVSTAAHLTTGRRAMTGAVAAAAVSCDPHTRWGWAVGTNWLKVWGRCGDAVSDGQIQSTVAVADGLWTDIKAYMGRAPNEDAGTADQGGDTRLDIYLVTNCLRRDNENNCLGGDHGGAWSSQEFIERGGVAASSAYILVNRSRLADPHKLKDTLAHELFHAFQYSFNHDGFMDGSEALWFLDASATWAEWRFAGAATEVAPIFSAFQGSYVSLQSDAAGNGYLSFGWPLFMEQKAGAGTVARAWSAIVGKSDNAQIMDALNGVFAFDANFRIFAMRVWNRELGIGDPVDPLLPADPVSIGGRIPPRSTRTAAEIDLQPTQPGTAPRRITEDIPTLFGHYQPFKVDEDVGRVILDFGGLSPADILDVDALVKVRGKSNWERRELPDGKTTWCTDNPDDDIEEFVVVLSNHARHTRPNVTGSWTVESPAEPCLSYHIKINWFDTWNGVTDGTTFDGYADAVDPNPIGDVVVLTGTGTVTGTRAGYIACNPGLEGQTASGTANATFIAVVSGETVTVSAWGDMLTIFSGVTTAPFEVPRKGGTKPITGALIPSDPCPHSHSGTAEVTVKIKPP